jgi:hypothetical protein
MKQIGNQNKAGRLELIRGLLVWLDREINLCESAELLGMHRLELQVGVNSGG